MTLSDMLKLLQPGWPDKEAMDAAMRGLSESDVMSPQEFEALAQPRAERLDYPHNFVIQGGPLPPGGMRPIPNYNAPTPRAFPYDREAPPQRNRDLYGGRR